MQLRRACAYRTHIDRESWCVCVCVPARPHSWARLYHVVPPPESISGTLSDVMCNFVLFNGRRNWTDEAAYEIKQLIAANKMCAPAHVQRDYMSGCKRRKLFHWIAGSGKPSTCLQVALDWWTKMMDCLDQKTQFRLFFSFLSAFVFLSRKVLLGIGWNGYELRRRGQRHGTDHGPRRNGWIG